MNSLWKVFTTTIGKKAVMAATGGVLLMFVVMHMTGNMQMFLGWGDINHYADFLKSHREALWPFRTILAVCLILHVATGVFLTIGNRRRRETPYDVKKLVGASLASRMMLTSGLIVLCFIVYHLLHFTMGVTNPEYLTFQDSHGRADVYKMIMTAFSGLATAGFYVLGVGTLGFHLSHGVRAMVESLGLRMETWASRIDKTSTVVACLLFLGFVSVPLAVLMGVLK
ncbi:MAG: succinate dehydrogenase cytochrome b subunit [Verrucomicrobiia bacterium]|jgi:succinate dehydrogenase / fumarate reductase cytochrome b subunit